MKTVRWSALLLLAGAAALSGACSTAPVPREHFYRVELPAPPARPAPPLAGTLVIRRFEADGLVMQRPLLYSEQGRDNVQQYHYHSWIDSPTKMLQEALAVYLRQAGTAENVVVPRMRVPAEYEVAGRLRRFERVLGGDAPRVVFDLELAVKRRSDDSLQLLRDYRAERSVSDDEIVTSVTALQALVAEVFAEFERDLAGL